MLAVEVHFVSCLESRGWIRLVLYPQLRSFRNLGCDPFQSGNLVVFNPLSSDMRDYSLRAEMILLKRHCGGMEGAG